jgi:hypothetical protein
MKKLIASVVVPFLSVVGLPAAAQGLDKQPLTEKNYLGFEAGAVNVEELASNVARSNAVTMVNLVGGSVNYSYPTHLAHGRLYTGAQEWESMGWEVGYLFSDSLDTLYAGRSSGGTAYTASDSYVFSFLDFGATFHGEKGGSLDGYFLKLGGHRSQIDQTINFRVSNTAYTATYKQSGFGPFFAVGYDKGYGKNFDWRVSYAFYGNIAGRSDLSAYLVNAGIVSKW